MIKVNKSKLQPTWVEYKDTGAKIQIRPFSVFANNSLPSGQDAAEQISEFWKIYNYVVIAWEGIVDEEDKVFECNDENKKILYDYDVELRSFIIDAALKVRQSVVSEDELKN